MPLLPLPSSGNVGSETPLLALEALFRHVAVWLPDKILLVAPIVLGGAGLFRLIRSRFGVGSAAAIYGATLYVVNPFVADRYLAGHLFFLLAFSLLPWALGPVLDLLDRPDARTGVFIGVWLVGLAAIDLHVGGMYALLVVIGGVAGLSRRSATGAVVGLTVGALLCAYWFVPSLFAFPGSRINAADLAAYASRPSGMRVLPALTGLYGFWRNEFAGPAQRIPALYVLLVPIVGLAIAGASMVLASPRSRRVGSVIVVAAFAGLLLAAGSSFPPTAGAFRWMYDHVPMFRIYREPQKFLALVVLAYAMFGRSVSRRSREAARGSARCGHGESPLWRSGRRWPTRTRCCGASGGRCPLAVPDGLGARRPDDGGAGTGTRARAAVAPVRGLVLHRGQDRREPCAVVLLSRGARRRQRRVQPDPDTVGRPVLELDHRHARSSGTGE